MKITSYVDLYSSLSILDSILNKLQIPINPGDRIHKAYSVVRELSLIYKDSEKLKLFLDKTDRINVHMALFDVQAIKDVLPYLHEVSDDILKDKLLKLLNGTFSHLETESNSLSRNTLFELSLFTYFREAGLDTKLCNPNPDILTTIGNKKYLFECKRVFNDRRETIERTVRNAAKQLEIGLRDQSEESYGIIALSVEPFFSAGGKMFIQNSIEDALRSFDSHLRSLIMQYGDIWQKEKNIKNKKIIAVFLHIQVAGGIVEATMQSTGHYIIANNTQFPAPPSFDVLKNDFNMLFKNQ